MSFFAPLLLLLASLFTSQDATKELVVQSGRSGVSMHARPDGSLMATGGAGGIQLWDSKGRLLRTISHVGRVSSMALNPKYDLLVKKDVLLDLHGNPVTELITTQVWEGKTYTGHPGGQGYTWSPDGEVLAVETTSGFVLFDRKGETLAEVPGHLDALCFSPSSDEVYGGRCENYSTELSVGVWNLQGEEQRSFLVGEGQDIRYLAISPDGQNLAVALTRSHDATPAEGPVLRLFKTDGTWFKDLSHAVRFPGLLIGSADGEFLYSVGEDVERYSAEGELIGIIPNFRAVASMKGGLIGIPQGANPRFRKGRYVYHFTDVDGRLLHELPQGEVGIYAIAASPNADILATLDSTGLVRVWEMTGETLSTFRPEDKAGNALLAGWARRPLAFAMDGKSLVTHVKTTEPKREFLHRYSLSGKLLERKALPYGERSAPAITAKWLGPGKALPGMYNLPLPSGDYTLEFENGNRLRPLHNPGGESKKWGVGNLGYKPSLVFSPDGRHLYGLCRGRLRIFDGRTGKKQAEVELYLGAKQLAISPDGKYLACTGANEDDGTITLLDTKGNKLKELAHPGVQSRVGLRGPFFTHDGRGIVSAGTDGSIRIWLWQIDQAVNWLFQGDEWIMYTDEGLFDGSRGGGQMLGMTLGLQSFTVDQFALAFNRPDLILEILGTSGGGGAETEGVGAAQPETVQGGRGLEVIGKPGARRTRTLVEHFRAQYERRLRRAGLTEEDLNSPLHAPTLVARLGSIDEGLARLSVTAQDTLYPLGKLFYWVNGVPVGDLPLEGKEFEGEIEIPLGVGENRIEVSVLNSRGAESLRVLVDVLHEADVNPSLHIVSLGVSDYRDDALDLTYAHKDAQDLAKRLEQNGSKRYSEVVTHLLVNEEVTQASVMALLEPLGQLGVDDTLVLFIAGHGMHDTDPGSTWYFLTHETDLNHLSASAVPFDLLEKLLSGCPARHKLFLMDACESGELEEDWLALAAPPKGMQARTSKKLIQRAVATERTAALRSVDRNRYIFYDLLRRSGAIVYSSSRGSEFSYEDPAIENGWFTEKVMEALSGAADRDKDGWVDSHELRRYVTPRVAELTSGRQHPTVDRDNVHQTVRLPSSAVSHTPEQFNR